MKVFYLVVYILEIPRLVVFGVKCFNCDTTTFCLRNNLAWNKVVIKLSCLLGHPAYCIFILSTEEYKLVARSWSELRSGKRADITKLENPRNLNFKLFIFNIQYRVIYKIYEIYLVFFLQWSPDISIELRRLSITAHFKSHGDLFRSVKAFSEERLAMEKNVFGTKLPNLSWINYPNFFQHFTPSLSILHLAIVFYT